MKRPAAKAKRTEKTPNITDGENSVPQVVIGMVPMQKLFVVNLHNTKTHFSTTFKSSTAQGLLGYLASINLKEFYISISYEETPDR